MPHYDGIWNKEKPNTSFIARIYDSEIELLKRNKANKILDLGCGEGTNLVILAVNRFNVTGFDISAVGIDKAREKLNRKHLSAHLFFGDMYKELPFSDEEFDAVISYQSLNHNIKEEILKLFKELARIIKKNGIFSVKVSGEKNFQLDRIEGEVNVFQGRFAKYKKMAEKTVLPLEGDENGLIHYLFEEEEELISEIEKYGFKMLDIREIEPHHILGNFIRI